MVLINLHLNGRLHHQVSKESVQILNWEDDKTTRGIKESTYNQNAPPDPADGGIHHLPSIWDNLLEFPVTLVHMMLHEHLLRPSIKEQ